MGRIRLGWFIRKASEGVVSIRSVEDEPPIATVIPRVDEAGKARKGLPSVVEVVCMF